MNIVTAAQRVRAALGLPPCPADPTPALVVLAGLPGSGKSFLAAAVAARRTVAIVRSDMVRKTLYPQPTYAPTESGFVYQTCYALVRALLGEGYSVLFDATNLTQSSRQRADALAQDADAPCLLVWVEAPEAVIRERLAARPHGRDAAFRSDADWDVYLRMRATAERPRSPDLVADTHAAFEEAVAAIVHFLDGAAVVLADAPRPPAKIGAGQR